MVQHRPHRPVMRAHRVVPAPQQGFHRDRLRRAEGDVVAGIVPGLALAHPPTETDVRLRDLPFQHLAEPASDRPGPSAPAPRARPVPAAPPAMLRVVARIVAALALEITHRGGRRTQPVDLRYHVPLPGPGIAHRPRGRHGQAGRNGSMTEEDEDRRIEEELRRRAREEAARQPQAPEPAKATPAPEPQARAETAPAPPAPDVEALFRRLGAELDDMEGRMTAGIDAVAGSVASVPGAAADLAEWVRRAAARGEAVDRLAPLLEEAVERQNRIHRPARRRARAAGSSWRSRSRRRSPSSSSGASPSSKPRTRPPDGAAISGTATDPNSATASSAPTGRARPCSARSSIPNPPYRSAPPPPCGRGTGDGAGPAYRPSR